MSRKLLLASVTGIGLLLGLAAIAQTVGPNPSPGGPPTGAAGGDLSGSYPSPTVASAGGKTLTLGGTLTTSAALTVNGAITLTGTAAQTYTFPTTSATLARTDAANTFTGVQTMTSPAITTPVFAGTATGTYALGGTPTINVATAVGGTWTAASTWTLPAHTLGGAVTATGQTTTGGTFSGTTLAGTTTLVSGSLALDGSATYALQLPRHTETSPNRTVGNTGATPAGTTSGTVKMMGLGSAWVITPRGSAGKVRIHVEGFIRLAPLATTAQYYIAYGTGTAPSNAAAASGTTMSDQQMIVGSDVSLSAGGNTYWPVHYEAEVTGLTTGTAYWVDMQLASGDATHAVAFFQTNFIVEEK